MFASKAHPGTQEPGRHLGTLIPIMALLIFSLSACTQTSETKVHNSGPGTQESVSQVDETTAPVATENTLFDDTMPMAEYYPYLDGPLVEPAEEVKAHIEVHDKRQAKISQCMRDQGFEYYPVPFGGSLSGEGRWKSAWASGLMIPKISDDRDIVARWGYGVEGSGVPNIDENVDPMFNEIVIKNQNYADSLSPAARSQYNIAYSGSDEASGVFGTGGCMMLAYGQIPDAHTMTTEFNALFWDLTNIVMDIARTDTPTAPEAVALHQEWHLCMLGRGVDVSGGVLGLLEYGQPLAEPGFLSQQTPLAALWWARKLDKDGNPTSDKNATLQANPAQVSVALADFDCRQEVNYWERIVTIHKNLELQCLATHKQALDDMLAFATRYE